MPNRIARLPWLEEREPAMAWAEAAPRLPKLIQIALILVDISQAKKDAHCCGQERC